VLQEASGVEHLQAQIPQKSLHSQSKAIMHGRQAPLVAFDLLEVHGHFNSRKATISRESDFILHEIKVLSGTEYLPIVVAD